MNDRTAVWLTVFLATLSSQMIIPIIGLYTAFRLGSGPLVVGFVYGIKTVSSIVSRIPAAMFSGSHGNKNTMASGIGLAVLGELVYGFATTPSHMILGSLLTGMGDAFFYPSALSTIYEVREDKKGFRTLGYMLTAPAMGVVLGPAVSAAVLSTLRYQATFFTSVAISLIALAATRFVKETNAVRAIGNWKGILKKPRFLALLASCLLLNYVTGTVYAFLPLTLKTKLNYEEHVILLLISAAALANLSTRMVMSLISFRLDAERFTVTGSFFFVTSSTMFIFLNPFTAWAGIIVYGFGMGLFVLGSIYLTGTLLPSETRTMGFALLTIAFETGNALGNFFSGILLAYKGFAEVFAVAAASASMGTAVTLFSQRFFGPCGKHGK